MYKHRQTDIPRRGWRSCCLARLQQLIHCYHSDDDERPFTDHLLAWRRHPSTFAHRSTPRHLTDRLRQLFWKPLRASSTAPVSNLPSSLPYRPPIATRTNRPLALHNSFFATASIIYLSTKQTTATAEPVTDHIPLPQLHITLCIHRRAPTALLLPQHSSCILPIHAQFGFTPIGWVE